MIREGATSAAPLPGSTVLRRVGDVHKPVEISVQELRGVPGTQSLPSLEISRVKEGACYLQRHVWCISVTAVEERGPLETYECFPSREIGVHDDLPAILQGATGVNAVSTGRLGQREVRPTARSHPGRRLHWCIVAQYSMEIAVPR